MADPRFAKSIQPLLGRSVRPQPRRFWDENTFLKRSNSTRAIPFDGLITNKLLAAIPGGELARLLPHLEPVSLSANHEIYEFGGHVDYVYFPETAVVSHLYYLEDGSATEATIVGREGMLGLSAVLDCSQPYWTHVTISGTAVRIRAAIVKQEFHKGSALQSLILRYMSARITQLSRRAVCNGRHMLSSRFCTWLLMIHDRSRGHSLPLTHEEISNHLGARRPGITSSCNRLREKGVISYRRGVIEILDRAGLEASACECYRTLKEL